MAQPGETPEVQLPDSFLASVVHAEDPETYDILHRVMAAEIVRLRARLSWKPSSTGEVNWELVRTTIRDLT